MDIEPDGESQLSNPEQCSSMPVDQSSGSSLTEKGTASSAGSFQVFKGAVEKSINKLTSKHRLFPYVKEHFEPVYRADSKNVVEVFKSMMDQLKTMINEEIDLQLDCNNVQQLLGDLDSVKKGQRHGKNCWRPSGDPHEDLEAHLHETKGKELEHLEKIYRSLLSKNKLLNASVDKAGQHIESTKQQIDDCCQEWEEAASAIPESTREEIVKISLNLPCLVKSDLR